MLVVNSSLVCKLKQREKPRVVPDQFRDRVEAFSDLRDDLDCSIVLVVLHNEGKSVCLNGHFEDSSVRCSQVTKFDIRLDCLIE